MLIIRLHPQNLRIMQLHYCANCVTNKFSKWKESRQRNMFGTKTALAVRNVRKS